MGADLLKVPPLIKC